jgi:hypothetical protein
VAGPDDDHVLRSACHRIDGSSFDTALRSGLHCPASNPARLPRDFDTAGRGLSSLAMGTRRGARPGASGATSLALGRKIHGLPAISSIAAFVMLEAAMTSLRRPGRY